MTWSLFHRFDNEGTRTFTNCGAKDALVSLLQNERPLPGGA